MAKTPKPRVKRPHNYKEVGDFIRKHCHEAGLGSQKMLADRIYKHNPTLERVTGKMVSTWVTGTHRPSPETVPALLAVLGINSDTPAFAEWTRLYQQRPHEDREAKVANDRLTQHYLQWVTEQFRRLDLYGLHGPDRRSDIELEQVFVALRGGLGNPYQSPDRKHSLEDLEDIADIAPAPRDPGVDGVRPGGATEIPIDIEERSIDRLFGGGPAESLSLGEAFRREPRLVILGDPGSGKTTLLRWIALMLAKAGLAKRTSERVLVPHYRVDPNVDCEDSADLFDLGPAGRIPIYVRIATYLDHRTRAGGALGFEEHLGYHLTPLSTQVPKTADGRALDPAALNKLFSKAIAEGRAILLLDGLDEIANIEDRGPVATAVEVFFDEILFRNKKAGATDNEGNQVVVTSRIVGYSMAGLGPRCTHMTLEPMSPLAIERYCRLYTHARLCAKLGLATLDETLARQALAEAETIITEIEGLRQSGSSDLASTPLLLTILIMVALPGGRLPDRRAILYRKAVDRILETWRDRVKRTGKTRLPDADRLDSYLCHLAFTLQTHSGLGLIESPDARSCLKGLGPPNEIADFIECASEEIGLLTARGTDVVGFQHQTFQEYFAARWLVREGAETAQLIHERALSPRWREPILLALGELSSEGKAPHSVDQRLGNVLLALGRSPAPSDTILSSDYLLACSALRELVWLPRTAVTALARLAIRARAAVPSATLPVALDRQLRLALRCLSDPRARPILIEELRKAVSEASAAPSNRALAAAALLPLVGHADRDMIEALAASADHDSRAWSWPIDTALRLSFARDPALLASESSSLRQLFHRLPELAERFFAEPAGRRLAWLVYGGADATLDEQAAALTRDIADLQEALARIEGESPRPAHIQQKIDDIATERADLNQRLKALKLDGNRLDASRFHRNPPVLTALIRETLVNEAPLGSIEPAVRARLDSTDIADRDRQALALALIALSDDPLRLFQDEIRNTPLEPLVLAGLHRCGPALRLAVAATGPQCLKAVCASEALLENAALFAVLDGLLATYVRSGCDPYNPAELLDVAPNFLRPKIMAEIWRHSLSSWHEDLIYNLCVLLDTLGAPLWDMGPLVMALSQIANGRMGDPSALASWRLDTHSPRPRSDGQIIAIALDVIAEMPEQFGFVAGWMLSSIAPSLMSMGMHDEALIVAKWQIAETLGGRDMAVAALGDGSDNPPSEASWAIARLEARRRRFPAATRRAAPTRGSGPTYVINLEAEDVVRIERALANLGESARRAVASEAGAPIPDLAVLEVAYALEWSTNPDDSSHISTERLEACLKALEAAGDPDNALRLLLRLSAHLPEELAPALLGCALDQLEAISHVVEKAEAILLLDPFIDRHPDLRPQLDMAIAALPEWYGDIARGLNSGHVYWAVDVIEQSGCDSSALALASLAVDIETLTRDNLLPPVSRAARPGSAAPASAPGGSQNLVLDRRAVQHLQTLVGKDNNKLRRAIVASGPPTIGAMPTIAAWERLPELRNHAALLRTQLVGLQAETVRPLIDLLNDPDDLTRCRAAMLLYGEERGGASMIRVSRRGTEIVEAIADLALELAAPTVDDHRRGLVVSWLAEYVRYDDRDAIQAWVADLEGSGEAGGNRGDIARYILSHISEASRSVQLDLVAALAGGSETLQLAILSSLTLMAGRSTLCEEAFAMLAQVAPQIGDKVREQTWFLPSLTSFADAAISGEAPALWSLFPEDGDLTTLRHRFTVAGSMRLYGEFYLSEIAQLQRSAPVNLDSMRAVLLRLLTELRADQSGHAQAQLWNRASEALSVTAAYVEAAPRLFFELIAASARLQSDEDTALRDKLESALVGAVRHHRTFTGRAAAMMLLSQFRQLTPAVCHAIDFALQDVSYVQNTTLKAIPRYRSATSSAVETLCKALLRPGGSALQRALRAQLLIGLLRNGRLDPELEANIENALAQAAQTVPPEAVYTILPLPGSIANHAIFYLGELDQLFYTALTDATSTNLLGSGLGMLGTRR